MYAKKLTGLTNERANLVRARWKVIDGSAAATVVTKTVGSPAQIRTEVTGSKGQYSRLRFQIKLDSPFHESNPKDGACLTVLCSKPAALRFCGALHHGAASQGDRFHQLSLPL
jgi:hypothetical protein